MARIINISVALAFLFLSLGCKGECKQGLSFEQTRDVLQKIDNADWLEYEFVESGREYVEAKKFEKNSQGFRDVKQVFVATLGHGCFDGPIGTLSERCRFRDRDGNLLLETNTDGGTIFVINGVAYDTAPKCIRTILAYAWQRDTYYFQSGKKKAEGSFEHLKQHGLWIYFFENGNKESEGRYDHGRKIGEWSIWDEKGQLVRKEDHGK